MPARLGARACRGLAASKELANAPKAAWRPGRVPAEEPRCRSPPWVGPLAGDSQGAYLREDRRRVPLGTDLHSALTQQPLSRRGIPFNPWSLLLEVLDDPRIEYTPTPGSQHALLAVVPRLGWVTPYNVLAQRALLADHLLQAGVVAMRPQSHPGDGDGAGAVVLGPAQAMALGQMQWPRHIAQRYERLLSVPAVLQAADRTRAAEWQRAWMAASACLDELRAAYVKRRVLFNTRMTRRQQSMLVIRNALEDAPGLAFNTLMAWRGRVGDVLTPHATQCVCDRHFADIDALRRAAGQAWQLYDWLVQCSPDRTGPAPTMASIPFAARHTAHQHAASTPAAVLYAALCASDCQNEAH